ncbi:MAG: tetratricopeptide repeat protein [Geminicoccaceae bacterium]|nr:tetratricopeptide repeat protein [Geminicoccaceae bacterium]
MQRDIREVSWSGCSAEAMALFDRAIDATASFHGDPLGLTRRALELDPTLHAARLLQGHVFALSLHAPFRAAALKALAPLADPPVPLSEHEALHRDAIEAWLRGEPQQAADRLARILQHWPRDLMALFFSHQADFFAAQTSSMLPRLDAAVASWSPDLSGFGYLCGMRAFACEEAGLYGPAEELAFEALDGNPLDAWAIHARGHVLEMLGRVEEGIAWYDSTGPQWSEDCFFSVHNWWHKALYHLDLGEHAAALAVYDGGIAPDERSISLNLCDAAALLWRLRLHGIDTGNRWEVLAGLFEPHVERPSHVFIDVHAGFCLAAAGERDRLGDYVARLGALAGSGTGHGDMLRDLGIPAIQAAAALEEGRAGAAADLLGAAMTHEAGMTGSHAQRDLLPLTLIEAQLRSGRLSAARSRLEARLRQRPSSGWIAGDLARC